MHREPAAVSSGQHWVYEWIGFAHAARMTSDAAQTKTVAKYDDLARLVHEAILLLEAARKLENEGADTGYAPFNGYCARARSAYSYLADHVPAARALCDNPEMKLKVLREKGAVYGESHYWLEDDSGRVLDLIFRERKRLKRGIRYQDGKGASVLKAKTDKRMPARKETQRIIRVVEAALT